MRPIVLRQCLNRFFLLRISVHHLLILGLEREIVTLCRLLHLTLAHQTVNECARLRFEILLQLIDFIVTVRLVA